MEAYDEMEGDSKNGTRLGSAFCLGLQARLGLDMYAEEALGVGAVVVLRPVRTNLEISAFSC